MKGEIRDFDDLIHSARFITSVEKILYKQASFFVLPTVLETFGLPFVEAMACGTPVICVETEFARELCEDAAIYVLPDNIRSLADAMVTIVDKPEVSKRMRQSGLGRAKMFSWEREARETLELIKTIGKQSIGTF